MYWPQNVSRGNNLLHRSANILGARGTPFLPLAPMHFVLSTSGLHLPCAVPIFMGIVAEIAQPAYTVSVKPCKYVSSNLIYRTVGRSLIIGPVSSQK